MPETTEYHCKRLCDECFADFSKNPEISRRMMGEHLICLAGCRLSPSAFDEKAKAAEALGVSNGS